ncbi:ComEA family DNA-binding protein [Streptomyces roseirectus]|uniref:ComEA family DNA-binding protein n=1 Tax=Streptomyces roseirectus TaxID=2768066 RepID=A0A7H0IJ08_9ACTN|nr:ComEA family DNA-binding protein [Streptomyces roseirectus]QNP72774.1 ComEA family DNA-binding protein [Streptomyces roseirectus]
MAIRSRTRTTTATSGPGRAAGSDSRVRRRGGGRRASAVETRRRVEVLFGERAERAEGAERVERVAGSGELGVGEVRGGGDVGDGGEVVGRDGGVGRRARVGAAVWERMPVWVQARCGMERRGVVALTVVLVVAVVFAGQHFWAGRTQSVRAPEVVRAEALESGDPGAAGTGVAGTGVAGAGVAGAGVAGAGSSAGVPAAPVASAGASAGGEIVVDVSGKVRNPGVHRLPAGSRVVDALRAAGGVRPGASAEGLNQARFLVDGEQVAVGVPGAVGGAGVGAGGGAGVVGGGAGAAGVPVSLGTATLEQLDGLPGVGPVLAQHILDYRTQHGGFRSVDELRQVNGIGERRFSELRELVRP